MPMEESKKLSQKPIDQKIRFASVCHFECRFTIIELKKIPVDT